VTSTTTDALLREGRPKDLFTWSWQAILAGYSDDEKYLAWGNTLQYMGWLDELPMTTE
jgi:hypothetical protein